MEIVLIAYYIKWLNSVVELNRFIDVSVVIIVELVHKVY